MFFIGLSLGLEQVKLLPTEFLGFLVELGFEWGIPIVITIAIFGSILLAALNRPIIMFYEGYPLQRFRTFKFLTTRMRLERDKIYDQLNSLDMEYKNLQEVDRQGPQGTTILSEVTRLQGQANIRFPPKTGSVLPTRLGNAIRAFEMYSYRRYGIVPIILWSRLLPVLPTEILVNVKEVKASFNFLINTVLFVQILGLELLVSAPYLFKSPGNAPLWWLLGLLGAFTSFVISYLLYRAAVLRAIDWGFMFNTAFDLYRRDLLKQLGFRPPNNIEEERSLWKKILQLILYEESKDLTFNG